MAGTTMRGGVPDGYGVVDIDGGRQVLGHVEPDGTLIPFAVLQGMPHGAARAVEAHRYWSRAWAACQWVKVHGAELRASVYRYGPGHDALRFGGPHTEEDRIRLLAGYVCERDAYRATREIERDYRIEGDMALFWLVLEAVGAVQKLAGTEEALANGALRLQAKTRGPDTALARFVDGIVGARTPEMPTAVAPARPGELATCIGTILVTPSNGLGPVEITVEAVLDPENLEFGDGGAIDYCDLSLLAKVDHAAWDPARDGHFFRDDAVLEAVRGLMRAHGLTDRVDWAEQGMQTGDAGHLEAGPELVGQLWPDALSVRRAALASRPGFDAWIRTLEEDVVQGEHGYERGEFAVHPELWRPLYDEGLTPQQAFRRSLDAAAAGRDLRDEARRENYRRIQAADAAIPST